MRRGQHHTDAARAAIARALAGRKRGPDTPEHHEARVAAQRARRERERAEREEDVDDDA